MTGRTAGVRTAALLGALAVGALAGCASGTPAAEPGDVVDEAAQVALTAPQDSAEPAARLDPVPTAGSVRVVDGPFVDRVEVTDAAVVDGHVTASLDMDKDVSELLALEVDVAWYDEDGALIGSTRLVVDPEEAEEYHSTRGILGLPVEVATPGAVTATIGFPVVVQE